MNKVFSEFQIFDVMNSKNVENKKSVEFIEEFNRRIKDKITLCILLTSMLSNKNTSLSVGSSMLNHFGFLKSKDF